MHRANARLRIAQYLAKVASTACKSNGPQNTSRPAIAGASPAERGYGIRTVQELLGHQDVRTTMIYTPVLNRGGRGVRSPADSLVRDPDER